MTVSATIGDNGHLFGATTTVTLTDAVKAAGGPVVDRRRIQVAPPIKSTGRRSASVRLRANVMAPLEVNVIPVRRAPGILPPLGRVLPVGTPARRHRRGSCWGIQGRAGGPDRRVGREVVPLTLDLEA